MFIQPMTLNGTMRALRLGPANNTHLSKREKNRVTRGFTSIIRTIFLSILLPRSKKEAFPPHSLSSACSLASILPPPSLPFKPSYTLCQTWEVLSRSHFSLKFSAEESSPEDFSCPTALGQLLITLWIKIKCWTWSRNSPVPAPLLLSLVFSVSFKCTIFCPSSRLSPRTCFLCLRCCSHALVAGYLLPIFWVSASLPLGGLASLTFKCLLCPYSLACL